MKLTDSEQKRLNAALLATAVEMTLMDRIDPETALMASNDVFHILLAAMKAQPEMVMATSVKGSPMSDEDDASGDTVFIQALDLIDRATLALHASQQTTIAQARVTHAREAYDTYSRSLALMQQSQSPDHESENWRFWYQEILHGQEIATSRMHSEEGEEI